MQISYSGGIVRVHLYEPGCQRIEEKEAWFCGLCRFTNRRVNDQRMRKAADQLCRVTLKRDIGVGVVRINCFTSRSTCRQLPYLYIPKPSFWRKGLIELEAKLRQWMPKDSGRTQTAYI